MKPVIAQFLDFSMNGLWLAGALMAVTFLIGAMNRRRNGLTQTLTEHVRRVTAEDPVEDPKE